MGERQSIRFAGVTLQRTRNELGLAGFGSTRPVSIKVSQEKTNKFAIAGVHNDIKMLSNRLVMLSNLQAALVESVSESSRAELESNCAEMQKISSQMFELANSAEELTTVAFRRESVDTVGTSRLRKSDRLATELLSPIQTHTNNTNNNHNSNNNANNRDHTRNSMQLSKSDNLPRKGTNFQVHTNLRDNVFKNPLSPHAHHSGTSQPQTVGNNLQTPQECPSPNESPDMLEDSVMFQKPTFGVLCGMSLGFIIPAFGLMIPGYYSSPKDISPLNMLTPIDFATVQTVFLTFTCILVGLGSEIVFGISAIRYLEVTELIEATWMYAQLLFPLFLAVAIYSRSPFGLPFLVLGLWKLGFPDVTGSFYGAFYSNDSKIRRVSRFMNGCFTLLHHICATYVVCGIISRSVPLDRKIMAVLMPLVVQHWLPLLKYVSKPLYVVLIVAVEIWWEVEAIVNHQYMEEKVKIMGSLMLGAHWGYMTGGFLELVDDLFFSHEEEQNNVDKGYSLTDAAPLLPPPQIKDPPLKNSQTTANTAESVANAVNAVVPKTGHVSFSDAMKPPVQVARNSGGGGGAQPTAFFPQQPVPSAASLSNARTSTENTSQNFAASHGGGGRRESAPDVGGDMKRMKTVNMWRGMFRPPPDQGRRRSDFGV